MHQRYQAVVRGHVRFQPGDQLVHVGNAAGFRGAVLAGPTRKLPFEIIAWPAEIAETHGLDIDVVQGRERAVHGVVDRGALVIVARFRQRRIPEDAAVEEIHDVEHAADRRILGRQMQHCGHRYGGTGKRLHHPEFAVDLMRRFQQLPGRLGAQHVAATGRRQEIGRVRLAGFELFDRGEPGKARDFRLEVRRKRCLVERVQASLMRSRAGVRSGSASASGRSAPVSSSPRSRSSRHARSAPSPTA